MSQSNETPSAEEEKRPFQFSLRTMFVVMTAWGVFCAMAATFGLGATVACSVLVVWPLAMIRALFLKQYISACVQSAVLFVILVLACIPSISSSSESSRRAWCVNNLKQIGLALHSYESLHGCLPPAYIADASGKPMHSWRVLILPQLGRKDIYDKYDFSEPWDGPNNSKLHDITPSMYRCPKEKPTAKKTDTSYVVVVGPNTVFPGKESANLSDIPDGISRTIMFVEVSNSGIHWMEPRDLHVVQMAPTISPPAGQGLSSNHPNAVQVLFADGSVHTFTKEGLTPVQLRALLSRNGGEMTVLD